MREKAEGALLALALAGEAGTAVPAGAALSQAGHLTHLALSAALPEVRADAVGRLRDAHALARVARSATDPTVRRSAVASVTDAATLAEVATRSEHKDAAVAAVDRIDDVEVLRTVAARARNKAAGRQARERMKVLRPAEEPLPVSGQGAEGATGASGEEDMGGQDATSGESASGEDATGEDATGAMSGATTEGEGEVHDETVAEPGVTAAEDSPEEGAEPSALAEGATPGEPGEPDPASESAEAPSTEPAPSLAPRLRTDRKERIAQAEALSARLTALVAAKPFALRDAEVALRDARLPHDDLAALPPKLARQLREARAALFARAQEAREAEEWSRWGNATAQEELCKRMEALAAQTDLEKAAKELRTLDGRWAEVRIAPRDEATSLRQRYQTARAPIKEKLDAYFAEKAARENENLRLKQELAGKAEALADSTEWMKASEELKGLQARWKEIGPAPRKAGDAVWKPRAPVTLLHAAPGTTSKRKQGGPPTWRRSRPCASARRPWPPRRNGRRRRPRCASSRRSGRRSGPSAVTARRRSGSASARPATRSSTATSTVTKRSARPGSPSARPRSRSWRRSSRERGRIRRPRTWPKRSRSSRRGPAGTASLPRTRRP